MTCEKCEDKEHSEEVIKNQKKFGCSKCSGPIGISDGNRIVVDQNAELERIDIKMKKQHQELINGYDKQLEGALRDIATFSTKMLLMFEDYEKKGDLGMNKVLESIRNYCIMSQTTSTVAIRTIEMLIERIRGSG
jgi:hypothetical protein